MAENYENIFTKEFLLDTMMGPNALLISEELAPYIQLQPGMRVLDLGCGMGISSLYLAHRFQVTVFAADLWISPTDNARRFASFGMERQILPFRVDATAGLPFAREYFDVIFSVDSYHYFGNSEATLPSLLPHLKAGGQIAVAVPGLKKCFPDSRIPEELLPYWRDEEINFFTCGHWRSLWEKEPAIRVETCREMNCLKQAWSDWLESPNPYAQQDIGMMEAEGGKYYNFIQLTGRKI